MPSSMARLLLPPLLLSPASGAWLAPAELTRGLGSTAGSSATPAVMQRRRTAASPRAVLADPSAASAARANFTPAKSVDVGVMLLNLGGPDSLENVEPFLYNLFSDPEIITLPSFLSWFNGPLAFIISRSRAPQSREGYAAIGGSSPQLATTLEQGRALEASLARRGIEAKTYVAMRYWHPFTEEALKAIKADGVRRLVVLPLYPQFSISTSGSTLRLLERMFYADQELRQMRAVVIPAWYTRPGYVAALARLIREKCDTYADRSQPTIFFSAHGLPKKYIETLGDPYKQQTEATVGAVMSKLRRLGYMNNYTLAYQSRVGPVEWLRPYTDDSIRELGASGVRDMVTVPISFVSEHIETLEEIDVEYAELARECGITGWTRVPALGLEQDFIDDLALAVEETLPLTEERPKSDINEGRPVSLRVVNDLVQLRSKDQEIEFGPVRYEVRRTGLTPNAELINGRIAMTSITLASLYSVYDGTLTSDILEGRLPFSQFFGF